jgi:hypothetical protein
MPYLCHVNLLSLIMFKTNQQKETMQKTTYDLEEAIFHTEEDFDLIPHKEKTKKKETMTKKNIKKEHKYIGYHNTKEVCSATHWNKKTAQFSCEDILQLYFHKNTIGQTTYSLDNYIGWELVYVGYKEINA